MGKSKRRSHNSNKNNNNKHGNRRIRQRNHRRVEKEQSTTIQDEIEAQLERQRRKRALSSDNDGERATPPGHIDGFEFDPSKQAYFPKGEVKKEKPQQVKLQRTLSSNHVVSSVYRRNMLEQIPTCSLGHVTETCAIPLRATELRAQWAGRIMLSAMHVESSARRQFDAASPVGWTSLLPQLKRRGDSSCTAWDLGCKSSLHASSRTFDVQQGPDESRLPEIATLVDGGMFVRSSLPRVWTEQQYMGTEWNRSTYFDADKGASMIRFAPQKCLARLSSVHPGTLELLQMSPGQHCTSRVGICDGDLNDVAFHPEFANGRFSVAVAPRIGRTTRHVTLHCDITSSSSLFKVGSARNEFPKSDALCVEYLNENAIVFGHRNGAITLLDTREGSLAKVASPSEQDGSVTSIQALSNGHMFVAKKTFGTCFVFDIRMVSERKGSATLWQLRVPKGASNPTLSSCCSGVAVDPDETIVIAPFADNHRTSRFAMWSLANGGLVGSKPVLSKPSGSQQGQKPASGLPHTELRSIVTPSWELETQQDGKNIVKRRRNSWSLWFKSACVEPEAPRFFGSIHQVVFNGKGNFVDDKC